MDVGEIGGRGAPNPIDEVGEVPTQEVRGGGKGNIPPPKLVMEEAGEGKVVVVLIEDETEEGVVGVIPLPPLPLELVVVVRVDVLVDLPCFLAFEVEVAVEREDR